MKKQFQSNQNRVPAEFHLYTPAEVAAILNVSLRTVQEWIRQGTLPHVQLGGEGGRLTRISSRDLNAFIHQNYKPQR